MTLEIIDSLTTCTHIPHYSRTQTSKHFPIMPMHFKEDIATSQQRTFKIRVLYSELSLIQHNYQTRLLTCFPDGVHEAGPAIARSRVTSCIRLVRTLSRLLRHRGKGWGRHWRCGRCDLGVGEEEEVGLRSVAAAGSPQRPKPRDPPD